MANEVYSICFMCTVRCPIPVLVENDDVKWIEGNPHVPGLEGALCPPKVPPGWPCSTTPNGRSIP